VVEHELRNGFCFTARENDPATLHRSLLVEPPNESRISCVVRRPRSRQTPSLSRARDTLAAEVLGNSLLSRLAFSTRAIDGIAVSASSHVASAGPGAAAAAPPHNPGPRRAQSHASTRRRGAVGALGTQRCGAEGCCEDDHGENMCLTHHQYFSSLSSAAYRGSARSGASSSSMRTETSHTVRSSIARRSHSIPWSMFPSAVYALARATGL
jgi:hypothetical protein